MLPCTSITAILHSARGLFTLPVFQKVFCFSLFIKAYLSNVNNKMLTLSNLVINGMTLLCVFKPESKTQRTTLCESCSSGLCR